MAGQFLAKVLISFPVAGVDIPVAGPYVGLGAAQAVNDHGEAYLIGVDIDYTVWSQITRISS